MCTTYAFLFFRFGTSFATFPIFIHSAQKISSLCFACSYFGYSMPASHIYLYQSFFICLSIFLGVKPLTFSHANPNIDNFWILAHKVFCRLNIEDTCLPQQDCICPSYRSCWPCHSLSLREKSIGSSTICLSSLDRNSSRDSPQSLRFHAHNTLTQSLIGTCMLIEELCKNALNLTCSVQSMYFRRSEMNLPQVGHLFFK